MKVEGGDMGDFPGFTAKAEEISSFVIGSHSVSVISHIDADGITAASIADIALTRKGVPHTVHFFKKLDEAACDLVNGMEADVVWLTDLGGGYTSRFSHPGLVVCDHHPWEGKRNVDERPKKSLFDYHDNNLRHLNPHLYGFDGSRHISGAGVTYWVAKHMDPRNIDLSPLAIVGAVGDFQDNAEHRLVGLNRAILADAEDAGLVRTEWDLRLFGRETRSLTKLFQYANDPPLPGLSNDWYGARRFLVDRCRIRLQDASKKERAWSDLDANERQRIRDELVVCLEKQGHLDLVERAYGEIYLLIKEESGTELHEAKEFSTLLNSCGRYGKEQLGLKVCLAAVYDGMTSAEEKGTQLEEALVQLRNHRENLIDAMNFFFSEERKGPFCERRGSVQMLKADGSYLLPETVTVTGPDGTEEKEVFRDTTVGIVVGMVLSSGKIKDDIPLISMMRSDGKVKVSGRGNHRMIERGLDLSAAMRGAAETVGGTGGGHNIAAGATIPEDMVEGFISAIDDLVGAQFKGKRA
jgi:RecJ-like exonuclease